MQVIWNPHTLLGTALFLPLHNSVAELAAISPQNEQQLPLPADCNQLLTKLSRPVVALSGKPVRFVPPIADDNESTNRYEPRVYEHGEVQTRENSWHDLFNALVWVRFPRAKAAINARHIEQQKLHGLQATRSAAQDAMTLFDESGVIVACSDPSLSQLLLQHEWKKLFWDHREDVLTHMRFYIFGHALYEKALQPYAAMTGKVSVFSVCKNSHLNQIDTQLAELDNLLSARLMHEIKAAKDFSPLPIMGVPGWCDANEVESFYDNKDIFRPARKMVL
ncbi:MAG: hypothetical protein RL020_558 [Pseudomonadota bacterium]|jgi:Protein of unknown function (DUF3025)